jgi:GNAT superfamily N-acetyltransferase
VKLFRHYKQKPYKFIGLARHSETLGEMVIYETLYDNPSGKIWVRPKDMFFENVTVGGQEQARFKPIPPVFKNYTHITADEVSLFEPILEKAFGTFDRKWIHSVIEMQKNFFLQIAAIDNKPVAFKLGYKEDNEMFYSWLGGVLPEFRGLGIATELMKQQHDWCRHQGFKKIRTKTKNKWRDMLVLNIKNGFNVVGTYTTDKGETKIILDKTIEGL